MTTASIAEGIGLIRTQITKQNLAHQDQITATTSLDAYQAQLQSLGVVATTVSAGSASSVPQALNALNNQLAAATGLSGYAQGAVRDLTAQLVAQLQAHGVTVNA